MKKINTTVLKYLSLIVIGLYSLIMPVAYLKTFHIISYIGALIIGLLYFISNIRKKKIDFQAIFSMIIAISLFLIIRSYPYLYINLLPVLVGIYILLLGLGKFITLLIYQDLPTSKTYIFVSSLIHFIFAIIFIFFPRETLNGCTTLIGLYLIISGVEKLYNYYSKEKYQDIIKAPSLLLSIKPYRTLLRLKGQKFTNKKDTSPVEVLIHVRNTKRGVFGHADLIYNGYIYSYGNYDNSTYKMLDAIGDGVLFKTKKEPYIKFCKTYGKTLFCFGLNLDEKELSDIDKRFNNILDKTYEWDKNNIIKDTYVDQLNKNLDISFSKFKEGYYQKYFFLNYNCVKFIEEIISPNILDFTSIRTPGILYSYLDNECHKKDSKIAYRNIY